MNTTTQGGCFQVPNIYWKVLSYFFISLPQNKNKPQTTWRLCPNIHQPITTSTNHRTYRCDVVSNRIQSQLLRGTPVRMCATSLGPPCWRTQTNMLWWSANLTLPMPTVRMPVCTSVRQIPRWRKTTHPSLWLYTVSIYSRQSLHKVNIMFT